MTATHNQENSDVAEVYEVHLLDADGAPDAESVYGVIQRFYSEGTLTLARERALEAIDARKLCGAEIFRIDQKTKERKLVASWLGGSSYDD